MDYVALGKSDLEVSRLCLGTWNMAGLEGWGPDDDQQSIDLVRRVQDTGCNFFDSAHGYGRGHSEEILGRALAEDERRERAIVATKIVHCAREDVEPSLDAALQRLRTDYVDLYIVHWPAPSRSLPEFMEEMCRLREKGKARQIGVSNFNRQQMETAAGYGVVSLQPPYNPLWRIIEPDVLPFCRESNIAVTPYAPLAQGLLTGRFTRGTEPTTGVRKSNQLFSEPVFSKAKEAARVLDGVADEQGCTSSQAGLAWLLRTEGVTSPIVGVSRWSQWEDNVGALDVELTDEQYARISVAGMEVWKLFTPDDTMWGWKPK
jgi:myo-inositol catabolism protein IolS